MSVVVITRDPRESSCAQCRQVKKFLSSKNVEFKELIFDSSNEEHESLIDRIGIRTVPIILPNGLDDITGWFTGFDINKLRALD